MINAEKNSGSAEVTLGTAYEINKTLVEKYEKELTKEEIEEKKKMLLDYLNKWEDRYFMLLNKEKADYTIFNLINKNNKEEAINILINECLPNRGITKSIELAKDNFGVEIWLSIDEESYCYYLFPYESAVIEV